MNQEFKDWNKELNQIGKIILENSAAVGGAKVTIRIPY